MREEEETEEEDDERGEVGRENQSELSIVYLSSCP